VAPCTWTFAFSRSRYLAVSALPLIRFGTRICAAASLIDGHGGHDPAGEIHLQRFARQFFRTDARIGGSPSQMEGKDVVRPEFLEEQAMLRRTPTSTDATRTTVTMPTMMPRWSAASGICAPGCWPAQSSGFSRLKWEGSHVRFSARSASTGGMREAR